MQFTNYDRYVLDRTGKLKGTCTGAIFPCRLEGCGGMRHTVRWPDGQITHPCSEGMHKVNTNTWRIGPRPPRRTHQPIIQELPQ